MSLIYWKGFFTLLLLYIKSHSEREQKSQRQYEKKSQHTIEGSNSLITSLTHKNTSPQPTNKIKSILKKNESRSSTEFPKYNGSIPPAPAQIYHGVNKEPIQQELNNETKDYHIEVTLDVGLKGILL